MNKKTGLITGCFDVLHIGHINLFKFAKKHVNYLYVGLDNDKTIRLNKGNKRPFFTLLQRIEFLEQIKLIDKVFEIEQIVKYNSPKADEMLLSLLHQIKPDYLISFRSKDPVYLRKKNLCNKAGVKLLSPQINQLGNVATTKIINDFVLYFQ